MSFSRTGPLTFLHSHSRISSPGLLLSRGGRNVPHDAPRGVIHELDTDLGDSSTGTGATENLDDLGELDLGLRGLLRGVRGR